MTQAAFKLRHEPAAPKVLIAALVAGLLLPATGCQKLVREGDTLLKGQGVTVAVKIPETPPPAASPAMAPRPLSQADAQPAPPASQLDARLIPRSTEVPVSEATAEPSSPVQRRQDNRAMSSKADTVIEGRTISEDLTLRGAVLVRGSLTVAPQATLRLEPGTELRFAPAAGSAERPVLLVLGRLVVQGTAQRPVQLGAAFEQPVAGDWEGVVLLSTEKKNSFEHCRIMGAQAGITARYSQFSATGLVISRCVTGLALYDSVASLTRPDIRRCDVGVQLGDSEMDVKDGTFRENRLGVLAQRSALVAGGVTVRGNSQEGMVLDQTRFRISGSVVTENRTGLQITGGEGQLLLGRVVGNREHGAVIRETRVRISDVAFTGNVRSGLLLDNARGSATGCSFVDNGSQLDYAGAESFSAPLNWWGTAEEKKVAGMIRAVGRSAGQGRVHYVPFLTAAPAPLP